MCDLRTLLLCGTFVSASLCQAAQLSGVYVRLIASAGGAQIGVTVTALFFSAAWSLHLDLFTQRSG